MTHSRGNSNTEEVLFQLDLDSKDNFAKWRKTGEAFQTVGWRCGDECVVTSFNKCLLSSYHGLGIGLSYT